MGGSSWEIGDRRMKGPTLSRHPGKGRTLRSSPEAWPENQVPQESGSCQSGWKGTLAARTHLLALPLTGNPARFEGLKSWVDFLHRLSKAFSSRFPGRELPTELIPYNCGHLNLMVSETRVPLTCSTLPPTPEIWFHCSVLPPNPRHANSGLHTPGATNSRDLVLLSPEGWILLPHSVSPSYPHPWPDLDF